MATRKRKTAPVAEVAQHTDRVHDLYSPSALSRRIACPGSARLEDGLPQTTSKSAEEGTRQHEILQNYVESMTGKATLDAAITDRETLAEIVALVNQIDIDWQEDRVLTETRVDLSHLGIERGGICDLIILRADGTVEAWDYKSGRYPVSPVNNTQLLAYLSGAVRLPDARNDGGMRVGIIQRNIGASFVDVTADELDEAEDTIIRAIELCKHPAAPLAAGDHCKFCRARGTCPQVNATTTALLETAPETLAAVIDAMPDAALVDWETKLSAVEAWCKFARETFNDAILAGRAVPGFRIGSGPSRRSWADGAEHAVADICGEHQVDPMVLASPAQIEKMLPKDARAALAAYIVKTDGSPCVKKEA